MKKKFIALVMVALLMISFTGCSKKITLNLAYGDRTGTYSGETVNGIPNGTGKFTSQNDKGESWTYEGQFKDGHFEGEGKTTWKSGLIEIGTYKNDVIVPMSGDEIKELHNAPDKFKNHYVKLIGKVFTAPEHTDGIVSFQMFADYKNSDKNTIVYVTDDKFEVDSGDYVKVVGKVGDTFSGANAFGGDVSAPTIYAKEYEVISYLDAEMPTLKKINVNQEQTQLGYRVSVQKVEFAEKETRVYVTVINNGSDKFNVYDFNTVIEQDGKQYQYESNFEAEYPELQSDLRIGNSTEGILVFPKIEQKNFTLIIEGSSENWDEKINDYVFNIQL